MSTSFATLAQELAAFEAELGQFVQQDQSDIGARSCALVSQPIHQVNAALQTQIRESARREQQALQKIQHDAALLAHDSQSNLEKVQQERTLAQQVEKKALDLQQLALIQLHGQLTSIEQRVCTLMQTNQQELSTPIQHLESHVERLEQHVHSLNGRVIQLDRDRHALDHEIQTEVDRLHNIESRQVHMQDALNALDTAVQELEDLQQSKQWFTVAAIIGGLLFTAGFIAAPGVGVAAGSEVTVGIQISADGISWAAAGSVAGGGAAVLMLPKDKEEMHKLQTSSASTPVLADPSREFSRQPISPVSDCSSATIMDMEEAKSKLQAMGLMRGLGLVSQAIEYPVQKAAALTCRAFPATCATLQATVHSMIPQTVQRQWQTWKKHEQQHIEKEASYNERCLGIPKPWTQQFYEDRDRVMLDVALGGLAKVALTTKRILSPRRLNYSHHYLADAENFLHPPKEFRGTLSRDLVVVQYHGGGKLGKERSLAWMMPASQGNALHTVEQVQECVALLDSFGLRTHVSVARIPAHTSVRFLHGRAKPQTDLISQECRSGGGVQYRFFDFDPKWIVETKKLP